MQNRNNRIIVGSPLMTEDTNEERTVRSSAEDGIP